MRKDRCRGMQPHRCPGVWEHARYTDRSDPRSGRRGDFYVFASVSGILGLLLSGSRDPRISLEIDSPLSVSPGDRTTEFTGKYSRLPSLDLESTLDRHGCSIRNQFPPKSTEETLPPRRRSRSHRGPFPSVKSARTFSPSGRYETFTV